MAKKKRDKNAFKRLPRVKFFGTKKSKVKEVRQERIVRRKNFFPTLVLVIILWVALSYMAYFVDPTARFSVQIFVLLVFTTTFVTATLIFANKRRGVITAVSVLLFLILAYFGVGNVLNFLLIAGLAVTTEIFLAKSS